MSLFSKAKNAAKDFAVKQADKVLDSKASEIAVKNAELSDVREQLEEMQESLEVGLLKQTDFQFETVEEYKNRLSAIRKEQRDFCRDYIAKAKCNAATQIAKSRAAGRLKIEITPTMKRVNGDIQKLIFRGFNSECDDYVRKVKTSNIYDYRDKIRKSADVYTKLASSISNWTRIPHAYVDMKIKELDIAYEYALFKEEEKEKARELRERQREEAKVKKEIEQQRKKLEKERTQYSNALKAAIKQRDENGSTPELNKKIAELETNIAETNKGIEDVDYREANQRAGYVYIISNIGAFGDGVYKIGMTRRLDPMERVRELGDASVPFAFDAHAVIFSDDAPKLEAALHREFDNRRVNLVNNRREFFRVSLDEIKSVVRANYDKTVEFFDEANAEQYRISEKMRADAENV